MPWKDLRPPPTFPDGTPLLTVASAHVVEKAERLPTAWTGSIVIIGGSYGAAEDIHQTPIGPMPGAMIIANAVHSLHQFGIVEELEPIWDLVFTIVMILITGGLLALLPQVLGGFQLRALVAAIASVALIMGISYASIVLRLHFLPIAWVDATLPCLGVIVHELFEHKSSEASGGTAHA